MFRPTYISRFLAGFMLIVFSFGIMPKRVLHDIFARHTDKRTGRTSSAPEQITTAGYNCDCDNLVAESAFVHAQDVFTFPVFTSFASYTYKNISFTSVYGIYSSLRGPPAIV